MGGLRGRGEVVDEGSCACVREKIPTVPSHMNLQHELSSHCDCSLRGALRCLSATENGQNLLQAPGSTGEKITRAVVHHSQLFFLHFKTFMVVYEYTLLLS